MIMAKPTSDPRVDFIYEMKSNKADNLHAKLFDYLTLLALGKISGDDFKRKFLGLLDQTDIETASKKEGSLMAFKLVPLSKTAAIKLTPAQAKRIAEDAAKLIKEFDQQRSGGSGDQWELDKVLIELGLDPKDEESDTARGDILKRIEQALVKGLK